jgi:hypothetical protein
VVVFAPGEKSTTKAPISGPSHREIGATFCPIARHTARRGRKIASMKYARSVADLTRVVGHTQRSPDQVGGVGVIGALKDHSPAHD